MGLRYYPISKHLADAGRESKAVEAWEAGLANQKKSSRQQVVGE